MYHFNEGTIDLPDEWKDVTINVLSTSENDAGGLSFTISRDTPPWGMAFREFAEREITLLSTQLKNFSEIERVRDPLDNYESVSCEFSWSSTQGNIHQLMFFVSAAKNVLILTATMPALLSESQKALILSLLNTLVLRDK
ncbi:DcrB-related protein [Erwinia sorbitola]|uniref:DUF1795 domain-containing protein n=1 Tax=Erwinia sorbitola TaxID=2681984 RepID=A0ABW9RK80_9GAMM|nr:DcrB-related protein [Erwinia sorbitola]MTD29426.1 DUF1795 domain-containing protein [Erwinia sorbitola]